MHQMVLGGNQLLEIDGVVVGGGVAGLGIALTVSCVHHLWNSMEPQLYATRDIGNMLEFYLFH
jgi:hypothetical protein